MTRDGSGPPGASADKLERLILWPGFTGAEWELPSVDVPGERLLVGWKTSPRPVDAGPPGAVAQLLATVLCRNSDVMFAVGLRPPAGAALFEKGWRLGREWTWSSTTSVDEAVEGIFGSAVFDWSQRAQVAILAPAGAAVPLHGEHLQLSADPHLFGDLCRAGALGVLLPGVDGDVAGFYLFTESFAQAVRIGLEEEAVRLGAKCIVARDDEFRGLIRAETP